MPDTEEAKKKEPMVDIDTSGPGANVELEKEKPEINGDLESPGCHRRQ